MLYFNLFYIFACDLFVQESYRLILALTREYMYNPYDMRGTLSLSLSLSFVQVEQAIKWSSAKRLCWQIYLSTQTHFKQPTLPQFHSWQSVLTRRFQICTDVLYYFFLCQEVPYHTDFCLLDSCLLLS